MFPFALSSCPRARRLVLFKSWGLRVQLKRGIKTAHGSLVRYYAQAYCTVLYGIRNTLVPYLGLV